MSSPKDYTLHMIGHGHIDPTWLWRWTEGFEEVRATFRSALDRMRETPDFRFTATSACFYEWVRLTEPEMFAEIQERVREGRWEIAGGMWIEPDCNIPHGEAFVRQGLYAQRFFAEHFGLQVRVGFNPDSFGHTGMLPQILRKLGMSYYAYQRPMPVFEMDYPQGTTFLWEAPDGSGVLASNIIESYNGNVETGERLRKYPSDPHLTPGQRHVLCFYGVGNHGGGPTKAAIAQIQQAMADPEAPSVRFSTLSEYFASQSEALATPPAVRQELQHHARGCYSAHAGIKRMNRRVEHALMTAERMAVAAKLAVGQVYPQEELEAAWKDLLYNQFHDILAGTSLESSYQDAFDQLGRARHTAHEITNLAVQRIARGVDTSPAGNTLLAFNPLPWPVRSTIMVSPVLARELQQPLELVDGDGAHLAIQRVRGESITVEAVAQSRYAFVADLPALGYRSFHARRAETQASSPNPIQASLHHLENQWWRLEFDPQSGQLVRLYDKSHQREVLRRGGILSVLLDNSDTWSHDVKEYRLAAGQFERARMALVEQGPVLTTLQSISSFGRSTALAEWTLHHDSPEITLALRVDWREAYSMLKLVFETNIEHAVATAETAYGTAVRPANGHEEPCQQWTDVSGDIAGLPYGFALLNDGQYSYDVLGDTLRLTLMRSPAYAHHDPARMDLAAQPSIMDQGWHSIRLRLVPHEGDWAIAQIPKLAWTHNVPPIAHVESAHVGLLASQASFLEFHGDNLLGVVAKQAEDNGDLLLRAYDAAGGGGAASLMLTGLEAPIEVTFAPHEIKSLRVATAGEISECSLLEEASE